MASRSRAWMGSSAKSPKEWILETEGAKLEAKHPMVCQHHMCFNLTHSAKSSGGLRPSSLSGQASGLRNARRPTLPAVASQRFPSSASAARELALRWPAASDERVATPRGPRRPAKPAAAQRRVPSLQCHNQREERPKQLLSKSPVTSRSFRSICRAPDGRSAESRRMSHLRRRGAIHGHHGPSAWAGVPGAWQHAPRRRTQRPLRTSRAPRFAPGQPLGCGLMPAIPASPAPAPECSRPRCRSKAQCRSRPRGRRSRLGTRP